MLGAALLTGSVAEGRALQDAAPAPPQTPPITDGATAFKVRGCPQCHTIAGTGGHKGPDLSGVGRRMKKDAIESQIVKGGDVMPSYGEVLQHEEIAALVEYLHKQRAKTPRGYPPPAVRPDTAAPAPESL
jgi:mono/diheme cytochrome c family protein